MKRTPAMAACLLVLLQGVALAHEDHHEGHTADVQMQKLHHMMPMYAATFPKVASAVEKRDSSAVQKEAGKILATTHDLRKSKPHKNLQRLEAFRRLAGSFEQNLTETVTSSKKGDFAHATEALKRAEATCAECHAEFR